MGSKNVIEERKLAQKISNREYGGKYKKRKKVQVWSWKSKFFFGGNYTVSIEKRRMGDESVVEQTVSVPNFYINVQKFDLMNTPDNFQIFITQYVQIDAR